MTQKMRYSAVKGLLNGLLAIAVSGVARAYGERDLDSGAVCAARSPTLAASGPLVLLGAIRRSKGHRPFATLPFRQVLRRSSFRCSRPSIRWASGWSLYIKSSILFCECSASCCQDCSLYSARHRQDNRNPNKQTATPSNSHLYSVPFSEPHPRTDAAM